MLLSNLDLLATAPGGVAKLRELIFALAVQGKLVPQDPADEPASVLLQKIREEKDRLIAEGKIKRDKPLAAIEEGEKPFDLPQGWSLCRLGDLLISIRSGGTPSKQNSAYWDGDIPWASVKDLGFGDPVTNTQDRITKEGLEAGSQLAIAGSILICTRMGLGKIGETLIDVAINQDLKAVQLGSGVHKQYFINYFKTLSVVGSGMTVAGIKQEELLGFVVPLPPVAEQSRIVTRVESLMRLCDALEAKGQLEATQHAQLVSTLLGTLTASTTPEELSANWQRVAQHFDLLLDRLEAIDAPEQTLLQLAVRGLLVPQDPTDEPASTLLQRIRTEKDRLIAEGKIKRDKPLPPITDKEKPFELPKGWEWVRWADIAMKIGDIDHKMPSEAKEGIPYVSPRDFYGLNEIDFDGAKKIAYGDYIELASKIRPQVGDLIYPRYGTIGVVRKVVADREFLASYSCAIIKVLHGYIDPDYQYLFSVSECAKVQAASATNKTTQPNVGLKSIQEFLIPLPPLAEQSRIVTRVTALRCLCADLRQRLAERQSVQARLADALMTNNLQTSSPYKDASHAA